MAQNELNLYKSNRGEDGQLMDWSKAAASLTSGIATAAGMRSLRRTENEQFKKSAEDEIAKQLDLADDSSKKFITFGADAGRAQINKLYDDMKNGRISRTQYKASTGNIKDKWTDVSELFKNMDSIYVKALENQENGTASEIEIGVIDYYGRLNDLGNKALSFDDNGNISVAIFNNEGKPIAYQNVSDFKNLMNTKFNKVDLYGMADVATKNLAKNKKYNVTDIRVFHPEVYDGERKTFQNTVLADSRSIASILVDYGGYGFYFSDADKQGALDRLKEKRPDATEADLVLLKQGEKGSITADITPEQLKKAQDIVGNEFDARFGREVDYPPGYGSGVAAAAKASASAGQRQETAKNGYISTLKAFGWSPSEFIGSNKITYNRGSDGKILNDFSGLNRSYEYKKNSKGYIDVYKIGETESFFTAKSPAELQNFAYGTEDEAEAKDLANEARALFGVTKRDKPVINKGKAKAKAKIKIPY
jgi:hypothetical protein